MPWSQVSMWVCRCGCGDGRHETLRTVDAQTYIGVGATEQLDPSVVDCNTVGLHGETRPSRSDIQQTTVSVFVPLDRGCRRFAGVPHDDWGRLRRQAAKYLFAQCLDDLLRHQTLVVSMIKIAIRTVDIAV